MPTLVLSSGRLQLSACQSGSPPECGKDHNLVGQLRAGIGQKRETPPGLKHAYGRHREVVSMTEACEKAPEHAAIKL